MDDVTRSKILGEGIHTAFRKASDHPKSKTAWRAIDDLPQEEWVAILDFIRDGLELPVVD